MIVSLTLINFKFSESLSFEKSKYIFDTKGESPSVKYALEILS